MNALRRILCAATPLILLLGLSACGSSSSGYSTGSSSGGSAASGTTVLAKERDEKYLFTPHSVTLSKGTKVTWTNKTDAEHSVTFDSGASFDKEFEANESVDYTFDKAGTYRYHCKYHPYMTGVVVVK